VYVSLHLVSHSVTRWTTQPCLDQAWMRGIRGQAQPSIHQLPSLHALVWTCVISRNRFLLLHRHPHGKTRWPHRDMSLLHHWHHYRRLRPSHRQPLPHRNLPKYIKILCWRLTRRSKALVRVVVDLPKSGLWAQRRELLNMGRAKHLDALHRTVCVIRLSGLFKWGELSNRSPT